MGYGHLRAAYALGEALGVDVLLADRPPLADEHEQRRWQKARRWYERTTRVSQLAFVGAPLRPLVKWLTHIDPLHPTRDQSAPTVATRLLGRWIGQGLGRTLAAHLDGAAAPLLTTFYAPAVAADRLSQAPVYCVVTDVDVNRVWVPSDATRSRIQYLVPAERTRRRLLAYGVAAERIEVTGFPLPPSLLGGANLAGARQRLADRLVRLDPQGCFRARWGGAVDDLLGVVASPDAARAPHLVYAVGGAGAQAGLAGQFLPSLATAIRSGSLRVTLVAGIRADVAANLHRHLERAGLAAEVGRGVGILHAPDFARYWHAFNALLADCDILWTKPSELTFYGALGLPLIVSWPVGVHERYNRRWAIDCGAAIKQRDPRFAGSWLPELLDDGTLATAAWRGFVQMPKRGTYRIVERLRAT